MNFLFGCLAVSVVIASLSLGAHHADRSDYCIVHWLLGFVAAMLFNMLLILGIWW